MPILFFKTAFACFKGVVVYLSCTVFGFLRVDLTFFAYDYQVTLMAGQVYRQEKFLVLGSGLFPA